MTEEKKNYEIGFLSASEDGAEQVAGVLAERGAEIVSRAPISRIALAYPIRKQETAQFGSIVFSAGADAISEIEKTLRMHKEVMRYMIIVRPPVRASKAADRLVRRDNEAARTETPPAGTGELSRWKETKRKAAEPKELTNEALEKKLEEILK